MFALSIATVFLSSSSPSLISLSLMTFTCFSFYNGTLKRALIVVPCTLRTFTYYVHIYVTIFLGRADPSFHHVLKGVHDSKNNGKSHCLKCWCFKETTATLFLLLLSSWGIYPFKWLQYIPTFQQLPNFYLQFSHFFWALGSYWQLSTRHLLDLTCLNQTTIFLMNLFTYISLHSTICLITQDINMSF